MSTPRHSVSVVAAVIDSQDRFLVIQRADNGQWQPPGGVLELDEPIYAGLTREVSEETGLIVVPERLTGVYKNMSIGVVNLVFRAHVAGGTETVSDETTQVAWWTAEQVTERMTPAFSTRLLDALAEGPPAIRTHDGVELID